LAPRVAAMFRLTVASVCAAALIGCGKTSPEEVGGGSSPSTTKAEAKPSARPAPERMTTEPAPAAVKPKKPEPESTGVGEWSRVGDVQVKVTGAQISRAILVSDDAKETEIKDSDERLLVYVSIQNLSKVKKLDYHIWGGPAREADARDEHGNRYLCYSGTSSFWVKGGVRRGYKTVQPEDPAFAEVLRFEKPVKAATEVRVTLDALEIGLREKHHFRIPSSEWAK